MIELGRTGTGGLRGGSAKPKGGGKNDKDD